MKEVLLERIRLWLDDLASSVVYAEEVEGRWAVRMRQETREATTVWFSIGERSLMVEAYLLPAPVESCAVHELALVRNSSAWRVFFAIDLEGALVLRGRIPAHQVSLLELDLLLGEIYQSVELNFRPMVRLGFPGREKSH